MELLGRCCINILCSSTFISTPRRIFHFVFSQVLNIYQFPIYSTLEHCLTNIFFQIFCKSKPIISKNCQITPWGTYSYVICTISIYRYSKSRLAWKTHITCQRNFCFDRTLNYTITSPYFNHFDEQTRNAAPRNPANKYSNWPVSEELDASSSFRRARFLLHACMHVYARAVTNRSAGD